jgi:metal-dependent amidase/aminoacylase/carboxypeptidase family protein
MASHLLAVDIVISWHPGDSNEASASSNLANISAKFRFRGIASHAAAAPDKGRSALDAAEAMDMMVNMMREHVPQETRIHDIITSGGAETAAPWAIHSAGQPFSPGCSRKCADYRNVQVHGEEGFTYLCSIDML